jgi:hypothetical protein
VYRALHRQGWRKIAPRPKHPKANEEAREAFKKREFDVILLQNQPDPLWGEGLPRKNCLFSAMGARAAGSIESSFSSDLLISMTCQLFTSNSRYLNVSSTE